MTWHCDQCGRQWEAPEGAVAHFHRCTIEERRQHLASRFELPADQVARDRIWESLLELVSALS